MTSETEPVRENNSTPDAGEEADVQASHSKTDVPPAPGPPEPPPPKTHCQITCKTEKDWWDRAKPFIEIPGIVLLAVYTAYTIKIYCANKKAADAAKSAAETARDALVKANRPWMGVDGPMVIVDPVLIQYSSNQQTQIHTAIQFTIKNFGRDPAFYVRTNARMVDPMNFKNGKENSEYINLMMDASCGFADILTDKAAIFPDNKITSGWPINDTFPSPNIERLNMPPFIVGCISYKDQFLKPSDTPHHTPFCFTSNNALITTNKGETLRPCNSFGGGAT